MNNKGFAVSIILYSATAVVVVVMLLILSVSAASVRNKSTLSTKLKQEISEVDKSKKSNIITIKLLPGSVGGETRTRTRRIKRTDVYVLPNVTPVENYEFDYWTASKTVNLTELSDKILATNWSQLNSCIVNKQICKEYDIDGNDVVNKFDLEILSKYSSGATGDTTITIKLNAREKIIIGEDIDFTASYKQLTLLGSIDKIYPLASATTLSDLSLSNSGLFKSTDTNSGQPTYYFRGRGANNCYVSIDGQLWEIVRINENKTIRLLGKFSVYPNVSYGSNAYFSEANLEAYLTDPSKLNNQLAGYYDKYIDLIVEGEFCEETKISTLDHDYFATDYTPTFKCKNDTNGYGIVKAKIGYLSVDEVIFGQFYSSGNYWYNYGSREINFYTMSPAKSTKKYIWMVYDYMIRSTDISVPDASIRPVINLAADTPVSGGNGSISDPFVIKLNSTSE